MYLPQLWCGFSVFFNFRQMIYAVPSKLMPHFIINTAIMVVLSFAEVMIENYVPLFLIPIGQPELCFAKFVWANIHFYVDYVVFANIPGLHLRSMHSNYENADQKNIHF